MFTLLLLSPLALALPGEASPLTARLEAAAVLRGGFAALESHDSCEHRFPILIEASLEASEILGESAFAASLTESVYSARWLAISDPDRAEARIERDLELALSDLEFEPLIEAELPEGFPAPTPVREIELKSYPVYRVARASMEGEGEGGAFWQLFQHINKNEIPMTAPVEITYDGERSEVDMAFMYEHSAQGSPGRDDRVEVLDIEPMLVASLGCRGSSSDAAIEQAGERLTEWIAAQPGLEAGGPLRQFGYNSPMVPNAKRYYEVQIPVRQTDDGSASEIVIDFGKAAEARRWAAVDDVVMGGVSSSRLIPSGDGSSVFVGNLSLENNGGFASVRSAPADLNLEGARGLSVRVRGDGKTYKLRLRMEGRFSGVSYQVSFPTTDGEWTESSFDFAEFKPTWRGRNVPDAPALDPSRVRSITFMISDKQAGGFRLELKQLTKF